MEDQQTQTTETTEQTQQTTGSWFDALPDDMKGDEALSIWKDKQPADVLKHALELEGKAAEAIIPPKPDAPQSEKDAFAQKVRAVLGVPETPEGYKVTVPEHVPANDPMLAAFIQEAHRVGYSPEQLQTAIDVVVKTSAEVAKANLEASVSELQGLWKQDFKANLDLAQIGIKGFAQEAGLKMEEVEELLDSTGKGNYGYLARMFAVAGKYFAEDKLKGQGGQGEKTIGQIFGWKK